MVLLTVAALSGIRWMHSGSGKSLSLKNPGLRRAGLVAQKEPVLPDSMERPAAGPMEKSTNGSPSPAMPAINANGDPSTPSVAATSASQPSPVRSEPRAAVVEPVGETPTDQDAALPIASLQKKGPTARSRARESSSGFEPGPGRPADRDARPHTPDRQTVKRPAQDPQREATASRQQAESAPSIGTKAPPAKSEDPFYYKTLAYHRSGGLVDATRLYRQVLVKNSNHPGALLNITGAYLQLGNYSDARPLLNRLERLSPRPKGVLLNQAIASIGLGDPARALVELDRAAAQSDASVWEIRFHRAVAFSCLERHDDALAMYRKVEQERPDDPRLQFNLAATCDTLGLYKDALAHYQAALKIDSRALSEERQTILRRIRTLRRHTETTPPTQPT